MLNDFGHLPRAAEDLLDAVARHAARVVADCHRWLRLLGPAAAVLERPLAELERAAADVAGHLRTMLDRPGDPVALWRAGERWRLAVAVPAAARAATFTAGSLHADDRWQGPAAEAYTRTLPPQHEALLQLADAAGDTAASLREAAAALVAYWTAVGVALTGLTAQLATAATATATPATAPAGALLALTAASECIATLNALHRALTLELERARRTQQTLLTRLTDGPAFPSGHWPVVAAASLSDASLTDGDASDWSLRR
ncbi:hypothetical protein ABT297_32220 [Dactylosporangium sp. NPDC000555]|uniref:hypothetical protein n=1 Tax=Dactylosporangium sp. NPDC000555 TaxID=3154260 RepID=UPI00332F99D0